jgi:hypothetical protein
MESTCSGSSVLLLRLRSWDEKHMLSVIVMIHFLVTARVYKVRAKKALQKGVNYLYLVMEVISLQTKDLEACAAK